MTSTTLTSWALLIWQTLVDRGLDAHDIFKRAELDPAKLGDGNARYPIAAMHKLWCLCEEVADDETFGMDVGKHWNVTTFHALGFAWLAGNTLKESMQRFVRYAGMVNNSLEAHLEPSGLAYRFTIGSPEFSKYGHHFAIDATNFALLKMCRMLSGESFAPIEVFMLRPPSGITVLLESEIDAPIHYSADKNIWIIDRLDMEKQLPTGNPALAQANEELALQYLNFVDKSNVSRKIQQIITEHIPSGPITEQQCADLLNMSVRTMQRKLDSEGQKFSTLLNKIRQELAHTYISNSQLSLNEIAYLLGFSEPASFTRAYRRWFDTSPSEFRKKLRSGQTA